jgi:hypothetical protein
LKNEGREGKKAHDDVVNSSMDQVLALAATGLVSAALVVQPDVFLKGMVVFEIGSCMGLELPVRRRSEDASMSVVAKASARACYCLLLWLGIIIFCRNEIKYIG